MELYHVWWPWLTSKRVTLFVSDSWVSCFLELCILLGWAETLHLLFDAVLSSFPPFCSVDLRHHTAFHPFDIVVTFNVSTCITVLIYFFKVTILSDSIVNNSLDSCVSFPVFEELHQIALTAVCSWVLCCVDLIVTMSAPPVPVGTNMDFCQPRYTSASTCERSASTSSCRTTYGGYTIQEWWVPSLQSFITCCCVFLRSASKA